MKLKDVVISQRLVQELLDYDPEVGVFTWKPRHLLWFKDKRSWKIWNTKFAGKTVGAIGPNGYVVTTVLGQSVYGHRIAWLWMTGEWPTLIDHIDQNRSNNRWANLREATHTMNMQNAKIRSDNTSGVKGVTWSKARQCWVAQIQVKGMGLFLGHFDTMSEALDARKKAELAQTGYVG